MDKYGVYRLGFADAGAADSALSQLQNNSDVQAVDYNYNFDPPPMAQGTISPGSAAANSSLSLQISPPSSNGKVIVALIDTSVDVQALGPDAAQFVLPQINVADGTSSDSGPTHGSAMASLILQGIQGSTSGGTSVQIQPVNVYGSGESTTSWDVAQGCPGGSQCRREHFEHEFRQYGRQLGFGCSIGVSVPGWNRFVRGDREHADECALLSGGGPGSYSGDRPGPTRPDCFLCECLVGSEHDCVARHGTVYVRRPGLGSAGNVHFHGPGDRRFYWEHVHSQLDTAANNNRNARAFHRS